MTWILIHDTMVLSGGKMKKEQNDINKHAEEIDVYSPEDTKKVEELLKKIEKIEKNEEEDEF